MLIWHKDSLTVYVINPPAETYYLDLLTQKAESYNNFHEGEREKLNQNMLSLLYSMRMKDEARTRRGTAFQCGRSYRKT